MAEGGGDLLSMSLQKLDDELTCPVCHEHFKEPKVLPCLHYYCKTCIADLMKRAGRGRPFNCPECRREALAINDNPESFPTAFFVNHMEEVFSVMKKAEPKEDVKCEVCSRLPSVAFCQQCSKYICIRCNEAHKTMCMFSTHTVVSIESLRTTITKNTADSLPVVHQEVKCSKHRDEPLKLYCHDCHKLVCRDCILIDHKDHKYAFVVDAAPQCKLDIKDKVEAVKKLSVGLKSAVKSLNESEKNLSDHSTATMKAIDDALDQVASKLVQKRKELKEEACRVVNKVKEDIATQEKNAQLAVGEVESLLEFLNRNLEKATDQEMLSLEKQMSDQVKRVSQLYSNPGGKFPIPQLPQLEVHSGAKVMQAIQDNIALKLILEIKVGTLVAKSLQQSPQGVKNCLQPFHVNLQFDVGRGLLQFVPLHYLNPGWEEACKKSVSEYIEGNVAEVQKIAVPERAYQDVMTLLYTSQQDDNTFVFHYPPQTTSLSFAGETNMVKATETRIAQICANYSFKSEEVGLTPEDYEFLIQLKMQDLINKSRSVEIEPSPETHSLVLSGPTTVVKAVKDAMPTLTAHASVEVELHQAIVQYLASEKGKDKLFNLLRCDKCAVYISESPVVKLLLLCSPKHKKATEKVSETIVKCTSMAPLKIPDLLLPVLHELPEFLKEIKRLEKETLAMVSVKEKEIIVAGFKDGVSQVTEALSAFVRKKMTHFQPTQMSIDPMIAKCIQENPLGLHACMSSIHVKCTLKMDKSSASVSLSPTKTTESDWKKESNKLFHSYIDREYLREKIEIRQVAAGSVFPILVSSQRDGNFHFETHADGSYAVIAGERSVVEAVLAKLAVFVTKRKYRKKLTTFDYRTSD